MNEFNRTFDAPTTLVELLRTLAELRDCRRLAAEEKPSPWPFGFGNAGVAAELLEHPGWRLTLVDYRDGKVGGNVSGPEGRFAFVSFPVNAPTQIVAAEVVAAMAAAKTPAEERAIKLRQQAEARRQRDAEWEQVAEGDYVIVYYDDNLADEMDVSGWDTFRGAEFAAWLDRVRAGAGVSGPSYGNFGRIEYEDAEGVLGKVKAENLTKDEWDTLHRLFGGADGAFPEVEEAN